MIERGWEAAVRRLALGLIASGTLTAVSAASELAIAGYRGSPAGVSTDGSVVMGTTPSSHYPFRWTWGGGQEILGTLPLGSTAFGAAADVGVFVGVRDWNGAEAFRWTAAGGIEYLGVLPGGDATGARAVSADGNVVVGTGDSSNGAQEAFVWTPGEGIQGLGDLPGAGFRSMAFGVSPDGEAVVGEGTGKVGREAFRWTADDGMLELGSLHPTIRSGRATDASIGGQVVVGRTTSPYGHEAFLWTRDGGMVGLGDLPGLGYSSTAWAVSGDGSVVVGESQGGHAGTSAFIWTAKDGMRDLREYLSDLGLGGMEDWVLRSATDISLDGTTIVGDGWYQGDERGWVVRVPEPSSLLSLLVIASSLFLRR